jgi:hypothetical protein
MERRRLQMIAIQNSPDRTQAENGREKAFVPFPPAHGDF